MPKHDRKMKQLEERCKEEGLRLTVQKRKVFSSLLQHEDHPTADEIYENVTDDIPGVSRTTVYRILESLTNAGLARRVYHPDDQYRFDPNTEHHHHLVCTSCEKVKDVAVPDLEQVVPPDREVEDFEIEDFSIYFRGTCLACRERNVEQNEEQPDS